MKNHIRFFLTGTFILIIVPFSFSQSLKLSTRSELTNGKYRYDFFIQHQYSSFENNNSDSTIKKDTTFKKDTLKNTGSNQKSFKMKKKPWLAVLFSAALPGAGQFYNESYWKTPILLGLTIFFGYNYYQEDKNFRHYRDLYVQSQIQYPPAGDPNLKSQREVYRSSRDDYLWYFIIVDFINMVDAYVDAHLFDFTVKEDKYSNYGKINRTYNLQVHFNF